MVLHESRWIAQGERKPELTSWEFEPESFAPIAKVEKGQRYLCVNDVAGNPRELLTEAGEVVWEAHYSTWGEVQVRTSKVDCPVRLQGQWHDPETGLHYNRFRYYDPGLGRYISPDPVSLLGGANVYGYAPNTTGWVDPWGLSNEQCGIAAGKNFKDHYIRHKGLLEAALGVKLPKWSQSSSGLAFRQRLESMIRGGQLRHRGLGTLGKGQPPVHVFEGQGLTAAIKPSGEFVTLLRLGEGKAAPGTIAFAPSQQLSLPGHTPW